MSSSNILKPKYWSGLHSIENMELIPGYFETWKRAAKEAEERGNVLVVFELPANNRSPLSSDMIKEIEIFLQNKLG